MNRTLWLTLLFVACGPEQRAELPLASPVEQPSGVTPEPLTGFPCEVREALQAHCAACHAGATYVTHFTTRDDLLAPGRSEARLGLEVALRLRPGAQAPMPPVAFERQPTLAERQLIDAWVQAGMPAGACGPLVDP